MTMLSPWLLVIEIGRLSTMITAASYDVRRLARSLQAEVRGSVGDDARSRALYAADASNYRAVPDLVVVPADQEDLATAVTLTAVARRRLRRMADLVRCRHESENGSRFQSRRYRD